MDNTLSYRAEVKKGLLGLLMFQLYSDKKTIYREYVQNALDAINQAVAQGILAERKDGLVQIKIDDKAKRIAIRDNGTGIGTANAVRVLLDISASTKDGVSQAGQFGIGRLVGGGYCHKLCFRTTAKGEGQGTEIVFDVDRIWKMVKEDKEDYRATEVIDACTHKSLFAIGEEEHFFEVILSDVRDDAAPDLLDEQKVVAYLNAVAPVEYKPEFKNTLIYKSGRMQPEFESLHRGLEKVQIVVGRTKVLKQYGLMVSGTKDPIDHLEYFKLEDGQFGMLGWGWFAMTKFTVQIPQTDQLAGIRLRKHNIQIGDATQLSSTNFWREPRGNSYFYGEVFVTHQDIEPNGARDGLAPGPATTAFYRELSDLFSRLRDLYTKANAAKKCVDKMHEGIKRIQAEGKEDHKSKDLIDNNGIDRFTALKAKAASPFVSSMIALYQPDFDKAREDAKDAIAALKPKSEPRKPIQETAKVQERPIAGRQKEEQQQKAQGPFTLKARTDEKLPAEPIAPANEIPVLKRQPPTPAFVFGREDKTASLKGIIDENEIWLLRHVFKVLNDYCPPNDHDRQLVEQLQKMIVKELGHGK